MWLLYVFIDAFDNFKHSHSTHLHRDSFHSIGTVLIFYTYFELLYNVYKYNAHVLYIHNRRDTKYNINSSLDWLLYVKWMRIECVGVIAVLYKFE